MKSIRINNDYCVYFHKNPITGEIFYVGIGTEKRAYILWGSSRNKFWKNYVNKHGKPTVEVVHANLSMEEACGFEIVYIKQFGRRLNGTGSLVNISIGGEASSRGSICSEESRIRTSVFHKNRIRTEAEMEQVRQLGLSKKGTKRTEEEKLKMSLAHRGEKHFNYGKHLPEETRMKIGLGNKGKTGFNSFHGRKVINIVTKEIFGSAADVGRIFFPEAHPNSFIPKLSNNNRTNNTNFQYLDEYEKGVPQFVNTNEKGKPKKVRNIITGKIYNSLTEASFAEGMHISTIQYHLKRKVKSIMPIFDYA